MIEKNKIFTENASLMLVEYHPMIRIISLFSSACFNIAVAIVTFSFTGLAGLAFGMYKNHLDLTLTQVTLLAIVCICVSLLFLAMGIFTSLLLKTLPLKEINEALNS